MTTREFIRIAIADCPGTPDANTLTEHIWRFWMNIGRNRPTLDIIPDGPKKIILVVDGIECKIHQIDYPPFNWVINVDNGASSRKIPWKTKTVIVPL
jgi:hypothetical protein